MGLGLTKVVQVGERQHDLLEQDEEDLRAAAVLRADGLQGGRQTQGPARRWSVTEEGEWAFFSVRDSKSEERTGMDG